MNATTNRHFTDCHDCQGEGTIELAPGTPWDVVIEYGPCPTCQGHGSIPTDEPEDSDVVWENGVAYRWNWHVGEYDRIFDPEFYALQGANPFTGDHDGGPA